MLQAVLNNACWWTFWSSAAPASRMQSRSRSWTSMTLLRAGFLACLPAACQLRLLLAFGTVSCARARRSCSELPLRFLRCASGLQVALSTHCCILLMHVELMVNNTALAHSCTGELCFQCLQLCLSAVHQLSRDTVHTKSIPPLQLANSSS